MAARQTATVLVRCDETGQCQGLVHMRYCLSRYVTDREVEIGLIQPDEILIKRRDLVKLING